MKMGEIRVDQGGFEMMTPDGLKRVKLRCQLDGAVMVEEVAGGVISLVPLKINIISAPRNTGPLDEGLVERQRAIEDQRHQDRRIDG